MEEVKLISLLESTGGTLLNSADTESTISSVSTDSRTKFKNGLFVAIKGDKVDGHDYIACAKENGAIAVLISDTPKEYIEGISYIKVEDTQEALVKFAKWYRTTQKISAVAVTGSVGKTTTKDMIASVLGTKYNVLKTEGNFNSDIGVPLTVCKINSSHDIAVIEMGMDKLGEIDKSSSIVKPNIAVITNIGIAHIERLKSRENILKAKSEVFNNLDKNGVVILNHDDDMLQTIKNDFKKVWFGKVGADITVDNITVDYTTGEVVSEVKVNNKCYEMRIPGLSEHLVYSALSAVAVGLEYDLDMEDILKGIANYEHTKMRMDIHKLKDNTLLIDDTYNANPASMKSLIDTVAKSNKEKKILILGDMFELGKESEKSHIEVLNYALQCNIDKIVVSGDNMKKAYDNLLKKDKITWYKSKEDIYNVIENIIEKNSVIAVKASRGMKFENITEKILER